jgi:hypothetical protein
MPAKMISEMPLRDDREDAKAPALDVVGDDALLAGLHRLEVAGDAEALHDGEDDGAVARVLGDLAPTHLALLRELLEGRHHHREQLQDDARADVRHDAEREDRQLLQGAAGEEVEQVEEPARRLDGLLHHHAVDARRGDEHADAVDREQAQRVREPLAQLLDLEEVAEGVGERHGNLFLDLGAEASRRCFRLDQALAKPWRTWLRPWRPSSLRSCAAAAWPCARRRSRWPCRRPSRSSPSPRPRTSSR